MVQFTKEEKCEYLEHIYGKTTLEHIKEIVQDKRDMAFLKKLENTDKLGYTINDAETMQKLLIRLGFKNTRLFNNIYIKLTEEYTIDLPEIDIRKSAEAILSIIEKREKKEVIN